MTQNEIIHKAQRWAKKNLLNEPLLRYWEAYQNYEEISFSEFKNLVLTGDKRGGNVISITTKRAIKPAMGIQCYLQQSIAREKNYYG